MLLRCCSHGCAVMHFPCSASFITIRTLFVASLFVANKILSFEETIENKRHVSLFGYWKKFVWLHWKHQEILILFIFTCSAHSNILTHRGVWSYLRSKLISCTLSFTHFDPYRLDPGLSYHLSALSSFGAWKAVNQKGQLTHSHTSCRLSTPCSHTAQSASLKVTHNSDLVYRQ